MHSAGRTQGLRDKEMEGAISRVPSQHNSGSPVWHVTQLCVQPGNVRCIQALQEHACDVPDVGTQRQVDTHAQSDAPAASSQQQMTCVTLAVSVPSAYSISSCGRGARGSVRGAAAEAVVTTTVVQQLPLHMLLTAGYQSAVTLPALACHAHSAVAGQPAISVESGTPHAMLRMAHLTSAQWQHVSVQQQHAQICCSMPHAGVRDAARQQRVQPASG